MRARTITVILILSMFFFSALGWAEESAESEVEKGASASIGWYSNYVWRGQKLSKGGVVQPTAGITYGGFGANLWANYDTDTKEGTETDLTLSYGHAFGPLSVEAGYIYYSLDSVADTQEVYAKVGYDILLSPSITYYHDFDEGQGGYLIAAIGHEFSLPMEATLGLGASASMNLKNGVLGTDSNGEKFSNFYNGELSANLSVPVYKAVSVGALVAYTFPLSTDAKDAIEAISFDNDSSIWYGGVSVSIEF